MGEANVVDAKLNSLVRDKTPNSQQRLELIELEPFEVKVGNRFRKDLGDLTDLENSIRQLGILQPIGITKDKELVYGERRLEIAKRLGIKAPCICVNFDLYKQRLAELHENIKRKSMNWHEEALAWEEIKQIYESQYGWKNRGNPNLLSDSKLEEDKYSQQKLADEFNVSRQKISQDLQLAKAIKEHPEIKKCTTKKSAIKKLKQIQRNLILQEKCDFDAANITLILGDFREKRAEIKDESIQTIIVDPPYGEQFLDLWEQLGEFAYRVLAPSGYFITYSGQMYLPIVFAKLTKKLEYFWTIALNLKERNLIAPRNVYNKWKPILIFYKPPLNLPLEYFNDVINGEGREKEFHDWQQGEMELQGIIQTFCPPNSVILDPMAGSGTTLLVAHKMGRKCIGIEIDEQNFELMKRRLAIW